VANQQNPTYKWAVAVLWFAGNRSKMIRHDKFRSIFIRLLHISAYTDLLDMRIKSIFHFKYFIKYCLYGEH